jgi:hypothetical protein
MTSIGYKCVVVLDTAPVRDIAHSSDIPDWVLSFSAMKADGRPASSRSGLSGPRTGRSPGGPRRVIGRHLRAGATDTLVGSRWTIECRHLEAWE